jgi:MFS family permease
MIEGAQDQGTGLARFAFIWAGQLASQIGTVMTSLGLAFWAFEVTGRATELALVLFFTMFPRIVLGPFIGLLVDRWSRKRVLIVCDLLAGAGTIALLILYATGTLRIAHLYALTFLTSLFAAFQTPCFLSVATLMLPQRHYGRSGGMLTLFRRGSTFLGPALAGLLYPLIGLKGILLIDVATFLCATGSLALVRVPEVKRTTDAMTARLSRLKCELMEGLRFLSHNRSVLYFNVSFGLANMFGIHYGTLLRPMVLLRTSGDEGALASILSMIGLGGVLGALVVTAWGGAKRKFPIIFAAYAIGFLAQGMSGLRLPIFSLAALGFVYAFTHGLSEPHVLALHQAKIPPRIQGRVFSILGTINRSLTLITTAAAGPLADAVFEPAMGTPGALSRVFGGIVGTGPGSGAGLMVLLGGLMCVVVFSINFLRPIVRQIETLVPDHDHGASEGS